MRMNRFGAALAAALLLATTAFSQKPALKDAVDPRPVIDGELGQSLDAEIRKADVDAGGFHGVVLVAKAGKILIEKGYGYADVEAKTPLSGDALWDALGVTRQFTAVAALKLAEMKKLSLDDALSTFLEKPPPEKASITLRSLLNCTSGFPPRLGEDPNFDKRLRASLVKSALKIKTDPDDSRFRDSAVNFLLAAAIVEAKGPDKSFEAFVTDRLFKPAGMKDAGFVGGDKARLKRVAKWRRGAGEGGNRKDWRFDGGNELHWDRRGDAGAVVTPRDLLAWDRALRETKVLSAASVAELQTEHKDNFALGSRVRTTPHGTCLWYSGGDDNATLSFVRFLEADVVVVVARSYEPREAPQDLAFRLADIVNGPLEKDTPRGRLQEIVLGHEKDGGGFVGSILVAADGKTLLQQGYGAADTTGAEPKMIGVDALWDWASFSKQFTAAAVLKLQDMGKLKLDDPLRRHVPEAPPDKAEVTIRQLLSHTSGIEPGFGRGPAWEFDKSTRASFEQGFLALPMTAEPGVKFEYSNASFAFAASLVERLSGRTFEQFCAEQLFKPAGMKDALMIGDAALDAKRVPKAERGAGFSGEADGSKTFAYGDKLTWGYRGCGGVVASTADILAWHQSLREDKVLSSSAKAEFFKPVKNDYALGWQSRSVPAGRFVHHGGDVEGSHCMVVRFLDADLLVVVATTSGKRGTAQDLAFKLASAALQLR